MGFVVRITQVALSYQIIVLRKVGLSRIGSPLRFEDNPSPRWRLKTTEPADTLASQCVIATHNTVSIPIYFCKLHTEVVVNPQHSYRPNRI